MERHGIYRIDEDGSWVQQSLRDECVLMDERKVVALFGFVVTSTTIRLGKVNVLIPSEDGTAEHGCGGF